MNTRPPSPIRLLAPLLLLLAWAPSASAQRSVPEALDRTRAELDAAFSSLGETRDAIAAERPALAREFEETALELRDRRRLARIARMGAVDRREELRQLELERQSLRQDASFLASLLKEHALRVDTLGSPGQPPLAVDPAVIAAESDDPRLTLDSRLAILDASLDRLDALLGGSIAPGEAAAADGRVLAGRFASLGPLAWFAADDGSAAGAVASDLAAPAPPRLLPHGADAARGLLAGGEVVAGIDVTGNASALEEVGGGFLDLIRKGGLWIWPILLLAALSLAFGGIKLSQFLRLREPGEAWVAAILAALRTGDQTKALGLAAEARHPAGPVMGRLVECSGQSADLVEETLYEQLMGVQDRAGSLLPVIAVTAATAPLLGLLGTVSGMIATFNLITLFGSGDPKPLAGGISEALVTTLFGLIVAIPALILHAFLHRRSQGIVQTTERLGLSFVNGLRGS